MFEEKAGAVLKVWSETVSVAIDFSERAHSQARHDLSSKTSGADFLAASSRLVVRQHVAEHVRRGGLDPASKVGCTLMKDAGVEDEKPASRTIRATPTYLVFSNQRRQSWKALVAPHRK